MTIASMESLAVEHEEESVDDGVKSGSLKVLEHVPVLKA